MYVSTHYAKREMSRIPWNQREGASSAHYAVL